MKFRRDVKADAIYMYLSDGAYAYGEDLDDQRRIDYDSDNTPIGVELLCVSKGVNLDGLPNVDEIAEILETEGIMIYQLRQQAYPALGYTGIKFDVSFSSPVATKQQAHTACLKEEVTA